MTERNYRSTSGSGKLTLHLGRISSSSRLVFTATPTCLHCGKPFIVRLGQVGAIFRCGSEFIGIVCDGCLDDRSKKKLAARRRQLESA